MKPPPIVYALTAVAWTGLILSSIRFGGSQGAPGVAGVAVMAALSLYFSFFAIKRFKYDRLQTGKATELTGDAEIAPGETLLLCQIEASRAVKLRLKLFCKRYEADESFPVQLIDSQGRVVIQDEFVPVFGRFRLEPEVAKEFLPLKVLVRNTSKVPRKNQSRVRYAEIAA